MGDTSFIDTMVANWTARNLSENSRKVYLRALITLNGGKSFKSFGFLRKTDAVEKLMEGYAESTKKTWYAAIVSALSHKGSTGYYKKTYAYYHAKMMGKVAEARQIDTAEKTETQRDNWVKWDDVIALRGGLLASPTASHLDKLVLSLYTEIPPRRNKDYLEMYVKSDGKYDDPKCNYLITEKGVPSHFLFNTYKTAKKYGPQKVELPTSLRDVLVGYLAQHPLREQPFYHLLVGSRVGRALPPNGITQVLNRLFKKRVGCSMLRHAYLSSKYDVEAMRTDATAMGHSETEQRKYMKKNNGDQK
jgi:hypothetical protein